MLTITDFIIILHRYYKSPMVGFHSSKCADFPLVFRKKTCNCYISGADLWIRRTQARDVERLVAGPSRYVAAVSGFIMQCKTVKHFLPPQRCTSQLHSNLWSTYHRMPGSSTGFTFSKFLLCILCVSQSIFFSASCNCACCVAACLTPCTRSSKTKFTAFLSLTQSQETHFTSSHTRGSSSSSSCLWVQHHHQSVWMCGFECYTVVEADFHRSASP